MWNNFESWIVDQLEHFIFVALYLWAWYADATMVALAVVDAGGGWY